MEKTVAEIEQGLKSDWALNEWRRNVDLPRLRQEIKEFWSKEVPEGDKIKYRKAHIQYEIGLARAMFFDACKEIADRDDDFTYWSEKYLQWLERRLQRLGMEAKILTGRKQGITPERIALARQYPIENLLTIKRGMALCFTHADKHPSMDVRKNFYYCYVCQATGDVIDILMQRDGLTFEQAINRLSP